MESATTLAFLITLFAGLATGIGSVIAFFTHHTNRSFFALSMGFSAGVMIYLSFVEILPKATAFLANEMDANAASALAALALMLGFVVMAVIDALIPSSTNPHENIDPTMLDNPEVEREYASQKALLRTGVFVALAIAIHNFPEGLATFLLVLEDPQIGIAMAIAVAMHNIPEGIAVSIPIYYATKQRAKAFRYSFLSGLAEPLGAVIGYLILRPFLSDSLLGFVFAMVAGVMIFLAIDTLLPTARNSPRGHLTVYGVLAGMSVIAGSLVLLRL